MKVEIQERTLTALNNLRDLWLMTDGHKIIIIKSFKYVVEEPEPIPDSGALNRRRFKKRKQATPKTYVTEMTVEGYHGDLKFVGTHGEDFCTSLVAQHNDDYHPLDLVKFRKRWTDILEQLDAFKKYEAKKSASESEEK